MLCTVTLNPIAPGMLTTMVRLMMLAATGGLSATLIFGRRLSAIQEW